MAIPEKKYLEIELAKGKELRKLNGLSAFNAVIQVCPKCGKIDVYKNDGHICDYAHEQYCWESMDNFWK